jgi:AGCS family alanine or glycine:cation symporter
MPLALIAQDSTETNIEIDSLVADTLVEEVLPNVPMPLDEQIDEVFGNLTGWFVKLVFTSIPIMEGVAIPIVLIILLVGALYFTIYFKFINFTKFGTAINIVRGKYDDLETGGYVDVSPDASYSKDGDILDTIRVEGPKGAGEVSHFQALTAALSGTVGLGNIAGVAVALSLGGPGATFWMIVAGLIGMASKFTECTLGVRFREVGPDGTVYGGPMYYLSKGLNVSSQPSFFHL